MPRLALQACSTRVCMITGDAEDTAVAIASAIGFFDPAEHRTLSGAEIEHMTAAELEVILHTCSQLSILYATICDCMRMVAVSRYPVSPLHVQTSYTLLDWGSTVTWFLFRR